MTSFRIRNVSISILLCACLLIPLVSFAERPNVILIMTDDQGYGDFGVMGNGVIETPHIDAMARRSASMRTFYVSPVCSPTRASLMTGRYNYRTRCIDTFVGRSMMEPEEVTIAEVLRGAGYATGIFGKWHLGDAYPMRPMDQGFEESLVLRGGGLAQPADPIENERRYTNPVLFRNGEKVQTEGYCTDVYFDAALEFIEASQAEDRNFFAYIATNAPHGPFHDVPEELREHYGEVDLASLMVSPPAEEGRRMREIDTLERVSAMITNIDENVGLLFAKLEALGLTDNTLVVFLVDNGPNTARYVGPFRGRKTEVFEGGIRSPLWMQWPAQLKAGMVRDEAVAHIDLMPTLLDACDVTTASRMDGRSFLGLLTGAADEWPDRELVIQAHRGDVPVRYHNFMIRDARWKLLHPSGFGRESFEGEPRFELYDLIDDPGETKNLAADEPEHVARLRSAYDAWFDDVSSTRPDNYAPPRIVIGSEHQNPIDLTRQDWRGGTWQPDSIGYWLVSVRSGGRYDFRVRFTGKDDRGTIELRVGDVVRRAEIVAGADEYVFGAMTLEAGDAEVHAVIVHGDAQRGVYQIEVSKR